MYDLIRIETARLGTFTHEIRYNSKAFKIFIEKEFDFKNENLMQREVLLHLLKALPDDNFKKFINSLDPLPFQNESSNHYIECILNLHKFGGVKDELVYLYEELNPSQERLQKIMAIGSKFEFDFPDDLEDDLEGNLEDEELF